MGLDTIVVLFLVLICFGGGALLIWKDGKKQKLQIAESPASPQDINRQIAEQRNRK